MSHKTHLLIIDPTPFSGGSKIATESILRQLDTNKIKLSVLSADCDSWQWDKLKRVKLYQPQWLARQEQGVAYFISHLCIALQILLLRIRLGSIDIAIGASGPGVDLSLYLIKAFLNFNIIQLIHGPVASSKTIARCLNVSEQIFYLPSARLSLLNCLTYFHAVNIDKLPAHCQIMENGLCDDRWPTQCNKQQQAVVFWAASLLKWKGLETLLNALIKLPAEQRPHSHICYIQPKQTQLPVSSLVEGLERVHYHRSPSNLDEIRSHANIFVSTSHQEPFGLSILEALAAGQCVLIPRDGAYWDKTLTNDINCIKYRTGDAQDLQHKLTLLCSDIERVTRIGEQGAQIATGYRASVQYHNILTYLAQATAIKD